jgi:hypothetical protein
VSDTEPIVPFRLRVSGAAAVETSHWALPAHSVSRISFDREELAAILTLYGRKVAEGEWRDYAIDLSRDKAVFSVFRRSAETPLYRIEKDPKLGRRHGLYSVVAQGGMILRRGQDLAHVLRVLMRRPQLVTA